jgi:DtxR family manganese transport transcriptional regulator
MLSRLAADGLVSRKLYRSVFLTEAGRRVARESRARHRTVEALLRSLGVSAETARIDAEGIEHHVSAETLDAIRRFLLKKKNSSFCRQLLQWRPKPRQRLRHP